MKYVINLRIATEEEFEGKVNLVTQAILFRSIDQFTNDGIQFIEGRDGLEEYKSSIFFIDDIPFSLHRYINNPIKNVTDVYLPMGFSVREIDVVLTKILAVFDLSPGDIFWQRNV